MRFVGGTVGRLPSLYTLLQIFSLTLFEKMPIQQAFAGGGYKSEQGGSCNQLNLFGF